MLISEALHRIDVALGEPGSGSFDYRALLNDAGAYFFASHTWRFAKNMRGRAMLVASSEYVRLPLGCARLIAIERVPLWSGSVVLVDAATFQRVRACQQTGDYYVAAEDYTLVDGRPVPRLALDHAPAATVANAFSVSFEAGWTTVTGEIGGEEMLPIPEFAEPYFGALLEAYALGLEQPHNGTVSARLAEVDAGPLRAAAIDRDFRSVAASGPQINTAVQMARGAGQSPMEFSTINLITS